MRSLLYDRRYYAEADERQIPLYDQFIDALVQLRSPGSVVDVGCGSGVMLERLARHGVTVLGFEGSAAALAERRAEVPMRRVNLERHIPEVGRFDVCLCIEVAEHLNPASGPRLVDGLCRLSDTVVFTAAPPGQGGTAHINERPLAYWAALFARRGFAKSSLRDDLLAAIADIQEPRFLHENLLVFERANGYEGEGRHPDR